MKILSLSLYGVLGISLIAAGARPAAADSYVYGFTTGGATLAVTTTTGSYTLSSISTGWYDQTGSHDSENQNYFAGFTNNTQYNDYFSFSLDALTGTVVSASLTAFDTQEVNEPFYTLYDVSTATSTVDASQSGATGIFADLGSGSVYGTHQVTLADNGAYITINLDGAAISDMNAADNGDFTIGGSTLAATPTPEPSSMALLGTGLLGAAGLVRRRLTRA